MIGVKRTLVSIFVSLLLVATAVTSVWLMASAGVFTDGEARLPSAPVGTGAVTNQASGTIPVSPGFQVAQPRDPFEPLVTQPPGGDTTSTTGGDGSTTTTTGGSGSSTSTTAGSGSTTTTNPDDPNSIRVTLLEIRDQSGTRVAVMEVDGETYVVKVGDTFATHFKVVSLTSNGGVFTYGDSTFSLAVGQSINK